VSTVVQALGFPTKDIGVARVRAARRAEPSGASGIRRPDSEIQ
jgi:hypothetical protein